MQVKQVGQQEKYRGIFKVFRSCFEAPHTIFKEFFTGNWSDSEANIEYTEYVTMMRKFDAHAFTAKIGPSVLYFHPVIANIFT